MKRIPYNIVELPEDEKEFVKENFPPIPAYDLVMYDIPQYKGAGMPRFPRRFADTIAERIYNLELRSDDIFIVSYPKTGTSLTLEMVWMMVNNRTELADSPQLLRCPWLECWAFLNSTSLATIGIKHEDPMMKAYLDDSVQYVANMEGRRVIKTHLPLQLLPPDIKDKCKVIYVSRNPKDTAVSLFYYYKGWPMFKGPFKSCIELFEKGQFFYGDYFQHLISGWTERDHPNVKFLWYEDMRKDIPGTIKSLSAFLEHPVPAENLEKLAENLKFENMKKNTHITPTSGVNLPGKSTFMRKGIVGDCKNHFDEEMMKSWDKLIPERLAGTGLEHSEVIKLKM